MKPTRLVLAAVAGLAFGTAAVPTLAQGQEMDTPAEMETLPAPTGESFTDEQIQVFATAFLEVQAIGQTYDTAFESAETPEEQQQLQMQAMDEMVLAVEEIEGITVDEYNAIFQAAQTDPALAQQLQAEVDLLIQQQ